MPESVGGGLSVIEEGKSDWLPDFGAPVASRDRAAITSLAGSALSRRRGR